MGGAGDDGWGKFVRTERNDLISRRAHLFGVRMLSLYGMTVLERDVVLRCDLSRIGVGALAFLARGCMVKPPSIRDKEGRLQWVPVSIGAASWIGPRAIVRAAAIGAGAIVGADAVVGERAVLGSFCEVKEGAVVAPGTNVPPFAVVAGAPAQVVDMRPDTSVELARRRARVRHQAFADTLVRDGALKKR